MDHVVSVARTSVGAVRSLNEDAAWTGEHLMLVADGMGGHSAGDVASALVVAGLAQIDRPGLGPAEIVSAIERANDSILGHGEQHPSAAGLGTTVCGMAASDDAWLVFNVGDSRCYSLTRGVLAQLTVDHSEVQELVDQGVISPAQARVHPQRNVITRAVGQVPAPLVDVQRVPRGGRFLLTTDGLPSEVDDATIAAICAQHEDATELAEALIAAAEAAGGRDNITVIIVDDHLLGSRGTTTSNTVPRELIIREVAQ